jgi:aminopeptidase Y
MAVVLIPLLLPRRDCALWEISEQAGKVSAIAVVFCGFPEHYGGALIETRKHQIAMFSMTDSDAEPYLAVLRSGEMIMATAIIVSFVGIVNTRNIIAPMREGDPDSCVLLGAHSDSVAEGPGINDNGSGAIALLEVATHLVKYSATKNCVRFAWWTGEVEGLLGSEYYMPNMSDMVSMNIRMAMDFDMLDC